MTATALLVELRGAGIRLSVHGDRLRIEAPHGAVTDDLRERLVAAKPELLPLLQPHLRGSGPIARKADDEPAPRRCQVIKGGTTEAVRAHLLTLAEAEGLPPAIVHALPADDVAACAPCDDDALRAYLRVLERGQIMDAGIVPEGYTEPVHCAGCGPVLLWPGCPPQVKACPWCFRRRGGKPVPRPSMGGA